MPGRVALALTLLLAIVLAAGSPAGAAGAPGLRWQWRKGEVVKYRLTTEQRTTQGSGEDAIETRQDLRVLWSMTVQDVDPAGRATIFCRFEQVAVEMEQMALGRIAWDSQKAADVARADEPAVAPFAHLVGNEFAFSIDPEGHVSDVAGYDKVLRSLLGPVGDNPTAQAALKSGFGPEWARASLERSFAVAPDGIAAAGATWTRTSAQAVPLLGTLRFTTDFRLDGIDRSIAAIRTTTRLTAEPRTPTGTASPGETADLDGRIAIDWEGGEGAGTLRFDTALGRLDRSEQTLRMTLRTRALPPIAPAADPASGGVRVTITQKAVVERIAE